jgi:16S rRNA (adenine1518-N6/adenine1519-N6)-dimethyltransferase
MKLSEMREILERDGIQLTKSLGQNFLHDTNQLRKIVEAAELTKADKVLEIGPGLGPLTQLLGDEAGEVLAIEKDGRLVQVLNRRFKDGNIQVVHADALKVMKREKRDWADWKLVANLPYSVASPILVELAQSPCPPERMVVTLQLEVARRLTAQAGDADYGVLSLLVQLRYEPKALHKIPASCFFPEPDVDSAFVSLLRRMIPLLDESQSRTFARLVKMAFSQRRKMMLKLLKAEWPMELLKSAFAQTRIPEQARAESVSLEQFIALTKALKSQRL